MSFTESIKTCFQKYIDFGERASRSEYWWFFLFTFIVNLVLNFIPVIGWIISLGVVLPSLAVGARRLHDTNKTGWWLLLYLVPILGWIALLVMFVQPGNAGSNQYGPNPLQAQQGMGGFGNSAPGNQYAPPQAAGGYGGTPSHDAGIAGSPSGPETSERQFCTQCGMQLQEAARFCTVCGAAA